MPRGMLRSSMGGPNSLSRAYTTEYYNAEYYSPLPRRPLDVGTVQESTPFLDCVKSSIDLCGMQFSGPGFRLCLYGVLTGSGLLPTGAAHLSDEGLWRADGSYAAGLSYYCPMDSATNW